VAWREQPLLHDELPSAAPSVASNSSALDRKIRVVAVGTADIAEVAHAHADAEQRFLAGLNHRLWALPALLVEVAVALGLVMRDDGLTARHIAPEASAGKRRECDVALAGAGFRAFCCHANPP